MTTTHSVCPWKTFTEWIEGSLKSQRRKVVSREEVTTSRWVGCVQQCVNSWSCPATRRQQKCKVIHLQIQSEAFLKTQQQKIHIFTVSTANIEWKGKPKGIANMWTQSGTSFPSEVENPFSHPFKRSRELDVHTAHFLILTVIWSDQSL